MKENSLMKELKILNKKYLFFKFKGFNLFNKKEFEKTTKHINNKIEESAEDFYTDKKDKEKDNGFEL